MTVQGDLDKHFWLTRSVARTVQVSMSDAMAEGLLTADGYAQMVARCRNAGCAGRCMAWLSEQKGAADAPPPYCVHSDQLDGLRRL